MSIEQISGKFLSEISGGIAPSHPPRGGPSTVTPEYLTIADFRQCLNAYKQHSAYFWCMPKERPETCPISSWEALMNLQGRETMTPCPSTSI